MDITKTLKAVIILDSDGKPTLSRHFDDKTSTSQFTRKLFVKTKSLRVKDDILIVDNLLVIHTFITDLHMYVIGNKNENPVILDSFLNCLVEVITSLSKNNVEKQSVFNHLSQIILALDEMCDCGTILEIDSNLVLQRIALKDDLSEQSMAQKLQSATEHIKFPWIRS